MVRFNTRKKKTCKGWEVIYDQLFKRHVLKHAKLLISINLGEKNPSNPEFIFKDNHTKTIYNCKNLEVM